MSLLTWEGFGIPKNELESVSQLPGTWSELQHILMVLYTIGAKKQSHLICLISGSLPLMLYSSLVTITKHLIFKTKTLRIC